MRPRGVGPGRRSWRAATPVAAAGEAVAHARPARRQQRPPRRAAGLPGRIAITRFTAVLDETDSARVPADLADLQPLVAHSAAFALVGEVSRAPGFPLYLHK